MIRLKFFIMILAFFAFLPAACAEVVLTDLEGKKFPFSSLKGKWVFINYWAGWCGPCVNEIREFNRFYQQNSNNTALFAVNYDNLPISDLQKLIKKFGLHYPSLSVDPGPALHLGDIRGVPATFVFNPEGKLDDTLYGGQTMASLSRFLNSKKR